MIPPRIVLCPIDFSDLARQELNLAVEACESFGAKLILHHNVAVTGIGLARVWDWQQVHQGEQLSPAAAELKVRELLAELPESVGAEAVVSSGPVATIILELAARLPADLIVIGSHGWSTLDHASVAERLIDRCQCPVLTVQEGSAPAKPLRLRPEAGAPPTSVLVPTDLTKAAIQVTQHAFELARALPLRLHLLHATTNGHASSAEAQLKELIPPDLADRCECHVERGEAVETIVDAIRRLNPGFAVVGEHAKGFFHRLLKRDHAREVLHRAECPVWFVPAQAS